MFSYLLPFRFLLLGFLALGFTGCSGPQPILTGLSQNDANQVIVVLKSQDISATKAAAVSQTGGSSFTVSVSGSDVDDALKILVDNKLPKTQSSGYSTVYPVGSSSIIPSSTAEKAQYLLALQGEVENMLMVLPGIVQASVVLVLPDPTVLRDPSAPGPQSKASVAIVYNPSDSQGNAQVSATDIQYLVGSAIPELPYNNVTVVMATNSPLKLIDSKKAIAKSVSTQPAAATTQPSGAQPAAPATKPATAAPKTVAATPQTSDKSDFLITLFGALAAIGLLFGVLGLVRSISLRAKLARMERSMSQGQSAAQVNAAPPGSEATVGAGE